MADAIGTQRVDTIVRQREAWAREVVTHFGAGRAGEALALLDARGAIQDCVGPQATAAAIVEAWREDRRTRPDLPAPLVIAKTNAQVLRLNIGMREVLRTEGALAPEDGVVLPAVTASGREHRLCLAVGDRLRFLVRVDALGVINGTEATLTRIEGGAANADGSGFRLHVSSGNRELSFAPAQLADNRGCVRLGHAYATTIYGAQGLTTETALVWMDAGLDRHDAFVAASRARGETRVFVDQSNLDVKVRAERALHDRSRPIEAVERQAALIRAMSRAGEKVSTLDYSEAVDTAVGPAAASPTDGRGRLPARQENDAPKAERSRARTRQRDRDFGRDA